MEMSQFSKENFNCKELVNQILSNPDLSEDKDIRYFASSMVMRLQLAIQEVNSGLEDTSAQILSTMPRVLRDIEALSQESAILKNQMINVKNDIEKVERETASSMQTLVELDTLKDRLLSSSSALKEADNWTNLTSQIEEVMECGDLEEICKKLLALQNCLQILTHVKDYENRAAHLEGLKVRLEAMLSPKLVQAFTQHNLEASKKYATMLNALGRAKNLHSCYQQCEIQQFHRIFSSGIEGQQMSSDPKWLTNFYDKLSSLLSQQVKWCGEVFESTDPVLMLVNLCHSILFTLDPSISHVVSVAAKQQENPLSFLLMVKSAGEAFLQDYKEALGSVFVEKDSPLFEAHRRVVEDVLLPLKSQMKNYQDYEESYLLSHLVSSELNKEDILTENLRSFRNYCSVINLEVDKSIERCLQITNGGAFPSLVDAITTYIENVNERLSQMLRKIEGETTSIQDDWTVFNTCLSLMQAAGELSLSFEQAEQSLSEGISTSIPQLKWVVGSNPLTVTSDMYLNAALKAKLEPLMKLVDDEEKVLNSCLTELQRQCLRSVDVSLNTIMGPVSNQLSQVPSLSSWNSSRSAKAILSVTFSPQEYITEIGQYLMTLPQHLEPLLNLQSPGLNKALQESYDSSSNGSGKRILSESEMSAADFLIGNVGHSVCRIYADAILRIPKIAINMITQLTTDIDYICNILCDLGVTSWQPLSDLNELLKVPVEDFLKNSSGKSSKLVGAVRKMRNIAGHAHA